ncbi:J domain-containing protein [Thermosulfurimonas sp. F29]|uniref:J domain-containing protein n=1 Tax=Thermosulfurimonas sp. F29 TaxID=2867247 RepID=UPI001C82FD38|nr:J domain-containing protein [Thermosulfurimonas sp. F29]MBX6423255.1 J domain-containing protein [Thermosulfurimonas sp. F29]
MRRNPFEILGLSPKIVKELDEENLFRLVRACYRALQQVHHPDLSSGSGEKALELNLAFEALNLSKNPESFRRWRKAYIKRLSRRSLKNQLEEMALRLGRAFRERDHLEEAFWENLLVRAREGHLISPPPRRLRIKVFDLSLKYRLPYPLFGPKAPFKEFLFDGEGRLYIRFSGKHTPRKVSGLTLVGCVPRDRIEPWLLLEKTPGEEGLIAEEYLRAETFRRACLPHLKPHLLREGYLFSFRNEDYSRLYLEGLILNIESLEKNSLINVKKDLDALHFCKKNSGFSDEEELPAC